MTNGERYVHARIPARIFERFDELFCHGSKQAFVEACFRKVVELHDGQVVGGLVSNSMVTQVVKEVQPQLGSDAE